jgi:hypothetical protein
MTNRPNERVLRAFSLSSELTTATELLALGLNQSANAKWVARQPGGVFTQLSQGVERVLKVTFWLHEQSEGREVDSKFGSGSGGHALKELNSKVFDILVFESQLKTPYIARLVEEVVVDPYWPDLLLALDRWAATSGRYRDLDALRGKHLQGDPPWASWEEAEHRAVTAAGGWANPTDETFAASRMRMLLSIMQWWHTLYRGWQHGLVGEDGIMFSSALDPKNIYLDDAVFKLIAGR